MRIPVFVSVPTVLSPEQEASRRRITDLLEEFGFEARTLGRGEYSLDYPLREVAVIARSCFGGVVLGFEQYKSRVVSKSGASSAKASTQAKSIPSPWNHLEAGILFGLRRPLLIFREQGVQGGVFDAGATDAFVHRMPSGDDELGEL